MGLSFPVSRIVIPVSVETKNFVQWTKKYLKTKWWWLHHYTPQRILTSEVYGQCPVVVCTYGEEQLVIFKYIPFGKFFNGLQVVIAYFLVKETCEGEARVPSHSSFCFSTPKSDESEIRIDNLNSNQNRYIVKRNPRVQEFRKLVVYITDII